MKKKMFHYFKDVPNFIVNSQQELELIRVQGEHGTKSIVDEINALVSEIETNVRSKLQKHFETTKELERTISQLNIDIQKTVTLTKQLLMRKDELEIKVEKEKQDIHNERENMPDDETLRKLCEEVTLREQDVEKRKIKIKAEYEGFRRSVLYYVKNLGCKIVGGEPGIILFDFAHYGALKSKKPEFYVELQTHDGGKTWKLIGMNPDLECREKLAERLEETNDVQGLLAYVRKLYKPLMDQRMVENNENVNTCNKT